MESDIRIIGIGGLPRSGKDSLAALFIDRGYYGVSLGDIVRNESRIRHADAPDPISVANMTETANHLRAEKGADFALQMALSQYHDASQDQDYHGLVVFSVRVPVEVDFILNHGGSLIWVEASDQVRHERGLQHLREGEQPVGLEEFLAQEALQWQPQPNIPAEIQMDVAYVREKATQVFENNFQTLEEFEAAAHSMVDQLS